MSRAQLPHKVAKAERVELQSEDVLAMFNVQAFSRECLCLGLSHPPAPFFLFEHFLGSQKLLVVGTLASDTPGVKQISQGNW